VNQLANRGHLILVAAGDQGQPRRPYPVADQLDDRPHEGHTESGMLGGVPLEHVAVQNEQRGALACRRGGAIHVWRNH
jgi:hypothetical protein